MNAEFEAMLEGKSSEELKAWALTLKDYVKVPPALNDKAKLKELIVLGTLKRDKAMEQRALDEAQAERLERLGTDASKPTHPDPETVAIETSPKVFATFINMENPGMDGEMGADVAFTVGGKYRFHLWDGQTHVLPQCLITEHPESDENLVARMTDYWKGLRLSERKAAKQAVDHLRTMTLMGRCVYPVFEMKQDPRDPNRMVPRHVRNAPRFRFSDIRPAPVDADYGLVVNAAAETEALPR